MTEACNKPLDVVLAFATPREAPMILKSGARKTNFHPPGSACLMLLHHRPGSDQDRSEDRKFDAVEYPEKRHGQLEGNQVHFIES